ncbi:hypothetical protein [Sphingomonas sp. M1-B02]|uniref:hypothetical protein n=1 Tax=Sphingomonas sp. M1-B02 TaxID=3114300 RepID=UPI00223F7F19|nr:hypothetical protein [Sphingomonas sp. S6-11]UZK66100.1 hypothetical protein OKW87_16575 [Sphingomonas sp. S6-11]
MNLPIAPVFAAILGSLAALGAVALPGNALESLVMDSGLPAVISAAEPPLGVTARAIVALGAGGLVALFSWLALFILVGTRNLTIGAAAEAGTVVGAPPVLRRADAHPDAPPRPPLLATRDLGTPFLEVRVPREESEARMPLLRPVAKKPPVEQALPDDLDQPLAAFDPEAMPRDALAQIEALPMQPVPAPPVQAERERFEIFELTPPVRSASPVVEVAAPKAEAITNPRTEASVHALLERLERGVARGGFDTARAPAPRQRDAERGLEEALVSLRNLARSA